MANSVITVDDFAKEATRILDNELVMAKKVFRGYEEDFSSKSGGMEKGDTLSIRKPTDFTVRDGAVASAQDVVEGKTTITVDQQKGIDFKFTSKELSLDIKELSARVIKPAMVQLANQVDSDLHALYPQVSNWVGTPGETINSFSDFYAGVTRMNELAVPMDGRCSVMSPSDYGGMVGSQTALYTDTIAKPAYRKGETGLIGGVDLYMTQNVKNHTVGAIGGTVLIDQALTKTTTTYAAEKDDMIQTIHIDGLSGASAALKQGDVFTIAGVYDVNPVTKEKKPFLKQFTVTADATAASNEVDLEVYPAMIWEGAFANIWVANVDADLNNAAVTFMGTAGTAYAQNLMFNKNAFALVMVPMVLPEGVPNASRKSYKGTNVRVVPYYDGTNDVNNWRLDILYGKKTIDPRLALRHSGAA